MYLNSYLYLINNKYIHIVVLGFLKTGSKGSAQGNFGLMDLVAAIHWLRENLPAFNGDPNKLILMGHGTGAALANILIASPIVGDLIRRAIIISGSALSPWVRRLIISFIFHITCILTLNIYPLGHPKRSSSCEAKSG